MEDLLDELLPGDPDEAVLLHTPLESLLVGSCSSKISRFDVLPRFLVLVF